MFCNKAYLNYTFGSWFPKKHHKVQVSLLTYSVPKVSTRHTKQLCTINLSTNSFHPLNYFHVNLWFLYEHVHTNWRQEFKTFLKESYAIALDSCYLYANRRSHMELNMMLILINGVCIYLRHYLNLQQIWWITYNLKILTEKKHPKIKLQRLRKIRILTSRSLVHQINPF